MKKLHTIIFFTLFSISLFAGSRLQISSPDGRIRIEFSADSLRGPQNAPAYQVFYKDKIFLRPSVMGFEIAGEPVLTTAFKTINSKTREVRNSWKPVYGERNVYPDNYNELEVTIQESILPNRIMKVVFRAYNEGLAFRYEFPNQPMMRNFVITREITEFAFPDNTCVWEEYGHEGLYKKVLSGEIKENCELPLTILTADTIYASIAEAGNSHYPRAYVQPAGGRGRSNSVFIQLRGEAKGTSGYVTSWRSIILADKPGDLMEQNYLILNLNEPCAIADPSWIKPGTAMRDPRLSTITARELIDYAAKQGLDYIIFDGGWYGPPNAETSDPSFVNVLNPGHTGLDLQEVIKYGNSKGVGVFLYVNRQGLERYMDKIFPLYESWGVKGIKPGFVKVGNQEWQEWIETMVIKAAEHHLMVNIHDAYRPTGFSRTYPNLLNQEGVHGNEQTPDADHNTNLPFTRFTSGAADYTPGYCRANLKNTWIHKLALPIIYYGPAQFLFWGEPLNSECHYRPELALWKDIPTVWDDTQVLQGDIGEYIIVARRSGEKWFVGGITNTSARTLQVTLDFLTKGKRYTATVYTDSAYAGQVVIEKKKVSYKTMMTFPLLPSGGFAMEISTDK